MRFTLFCENVSLSSISRRAKTGKTKDTFPYFWRGAFWGLMVGLLVGLIRFGLEFGYVIPPCGKGEPDPRPDIIKKIVGNVHYLHFGCILFLITLVTTILVSLVTQPIDKNYLYRLTYGTRFSEKIRLQLEDEKKRNLPASEEGDNTIADQQVSDVSASNLSSDNETVHLPGWRRAINCLCGVETQKAKQAPVAKPYVDPKEEAILASESIQEDPKWSKFVNMNAILVMSVAAFMWAWYA